MSRNSKRIHVKRYATGKYVMTADVLEEYEDIVADALDRCADLQVVFNHKAFRSLLAAKGLKFDAIHMTSQSVRLDDDTYASGE